MRVVPFDPLVVSCDACWGRYTPVVMVPVATALTHGDKYGGRQAKECPADRASTASGLCRILCGHCGVVTCSTV